MKKLLIKLITFIMILFISTGCYTLSKTYYYETRPNEYVYIYATILNSEKRDAPIDMISIRPINFADLKKSKKVEILSNRIKVVYAGKEYYLRPTKSKMSILPYDEGIILKEGTVVYFGKVKVDDKMIIDMPPVRLKQYLEVVKYNPIADGLNINTSQDIYYGPAEEYKGR